MPKKEKRIFNLQTLGTLDDDMLLSTRESANCIGVHYLTLINILKRGDLPYITFSPFKNARRKIRAGDLKIFVEKGRRGKTNAALFSSDTKKTESPTILKTDLENNDDLKTQENATEKTNKIHEKTIIFFEKNVRNKDNDAQ